MSTSSRERSRSEKAAAIQKASARRETNRKVGITVAIIVVVAVLIGAAFWATRGGSQPAPAADTSVSAKASDNALVVGPASAPTKVVVYEDFLCPYCEQFESQSRDFLRTDAAAGKVQVTYRPFHLLQDDYSTLALNAWSQVLDQGTGRQALAFHDALYENQPYEQDPNKPGVSDLAALAKKSGVPASITSSFGTENKTFLQAVQTTAQQARVQSTPTIMVDGKELKGDSIDALVANLEKQVAAG